MGAWPRAGPCGALGPRCSCATSPVVLTRGSWPPVVRPSWPEGATVTLGGGGCSHSCLPAGEGGTWSRCPGLKHQLEEGRGKPPWRRPRPPHSAPHKGHEPWVPPGQVQAGVPEQAQQVDPGTLTGAQSRERVRIQRTQGTALASAHGTGFGPGQGPVGGRGCPREWQGTTHGLDPPGRPERVLCSLHALATCARELQGQVGSAQHV